MSVASAQPGFPAPHVEPSPAPRDVSVIIAAYSPDRWEGLIRATRSALRQDPPPREVILVVDHNEWLLARARRRLVDVRVIANTGERGLAGARNAGVQAARGEIVAFLDDDAEAQPNWLARLIAPYDAGEVVGTGGAVEPEWASGQAPAWFPAEFYWVVGCSYRGLSGDQLRNPIGANMSFRRAAVVRSGGFADGLGRIGAVPLGCEETELALRLTEPGSGRVIANAPAARVVHTVTPQRTTWRYFRSRCWAEGVSKAAVSRRAGSSRGLASERRYVSRTLPAGVLREAARGLTGDAGALCRAGALCAGVAITTAGYVRGRLTAGAVRGKPRSAG